MSQYLRMYESLQADFQKVSVVKLPRSQNSHADSLATLASSLNNCMPRMITMEMLEQPSIEPQVMVAASSELGPSWMDPYIAFLLNKSFSNDVKEAEKVRRTAARFCLSDDRRLYQRSFRGLYLLILHPSKIVKL